MNNPIKINPIKMYTDYLYYSKISSAKWSLVNVLFAPKNLEKYIIAEYNGSFYEFKFFYLSHFAGRQNNKFLSYVQKNYLFDQISLVGFYGGEPKLFWDKQNNEIWFGKTPPIADCCLTCLRTHTKRIFGRCAECNCERPISGRIIAI